MKVLVLFYSMTGNTAKLAKHIAEGAKSVNDTEKCNVSRGILNDLTIK